MFKPKNMDDYDDFDEAAIEEELEAILRGNQPPVSRNVNKQMRANQRTNVLQPTDLPNLPNLPNIPNLAKMSKLPPNLNDLNLNMEQMNLSDDEDVDENDPALNAELAAILGEDLPAYKPPSNQPPAYQQQNNVSNQIQPTRPAPPVTNQQACIILDNSHFVNQNNNNKEQLIKWKDDYKSLALNAKRSNDLDNAKFYLSKMKVYIFDLNLLTYIVY